MDLNRLNEIAALRCADPDEWWAALEDLAPALGEVLVLDQAVDLTDDVPQAITLFRARDPGNTELYALVTGRGHVRVGLSSRLKRCSHLTLGTYDPIWHRVVSLVVTKQHRPLGDRLDLWVVVRRDEQDSERAPESVVYHGLVWLDSDGQPRIQPALDDRSTDNPDAWHALSTDGLPAWQLRDGFSFSPGVETFPTIQPEKINLPQGCFDLAVCGAETLCLSTVDGLVLCPLDGKISNPNSVSLRDKVRCLAFLDKKPGGARGIAGCDDRRLIAFPRRTGDVQQIAWLQTQPDVPLTIGLSDQAPADDWPDLLVGDTSGRLCRLHYVGEQIREEWNRCWKGVELSDPDARIDWLKGLEQKGPSLKRRRAAAMGMLTGVFDHAPFADPDRLSSWLEKVPELFPRREKETSIPEAPALLVRTLILFATDPDLRGPRYDHQGHFFPALVLRIYDTRLDVADRERIDETVRSIRWPGDLKDGYISDLRDRARCTPASICHAAQRPNGEDPTLRATFELQRWANAYLPSDTLGVPRPSPGRGLVGVAGLRLRDGAIRIAVAHRDRVAFRDVDRSGRFKAWESGTYPMDPDRARTLLSLPGREHENEVDRLLVIGTGGSFYLFDPEQPDTPRVYDQSPLQPNDSWVAAACPHPEGVLLVLVVNREHQARLLPCLIGDQGISPDELERLGRPEVLERLDLPEVHAVDISPDPEGGFRLLAGMARPGPAHLYRLNEDGRTRESHWLRVLDSGALTVRLAGIYAVAGEQNGFVCSAQLETWRPEQPPRLRWVYQMDGAIRGLCHIRLEDEPHILAGAESGELCLFRARDGRRVWKHRLEDPVRHVEAISGDTPMSLALTRNDALALFEQVSSGQSAEAFKRAADYLRQLPNPPGPRPNTECASAFYELLCEDRNPLAALEKYDGRETRARLLRYLAMQGSAAVDQPAEVAGKLTFRELTLLMSFLPDQAPDWEEPIHKELQRRWQEQPPEYKAGETAVATWLRRFGLREPGVEELLNNRIPPLCFSSSWIRLLTARLLSEATRREVPDGDTERSDLFPRLLQHLYSLPTPDVAEGLARVYPYASPRQRDFHAFASFLQHLGEGHPVPTSVLKHLEQRLATVGDSSTDDWPRLLAALIPLLVRVAEHKDLPWRKRRCAVLDPLRGLANAVYKELMPDSRIQQLVRRIRDELLVRTPLSADPEPLTERIKSVEVALRHLRVRRKAQIGSRQPESPWPQHDWSLLKETRKAIERALASEQDFLLNLVRPRLEVESQQRREGNRLELHLKVEAEGLRRLRDVSIQVDAGRDGGLRGPGILRLKKPLAYLDYPGPFPTDRVKLVGYLDPGQKQIVVRTTLTDGDRTEVRESWPFPVTTRDWGRTRGVALPVCLRTFREHLRETKLPVTLAVFDQDLGRDQLLDDWDREFPGRRVDLDAALRDTGPGRRYSERSLDLALIEQKIRSEAPDEWGAGNRDPRPLLIAPGDEAIQRLLDGEAPGVLEAWLGRLRDRNESEGKLLLLVSSVHAACLRGMGLGKIRELSAHRILMGSFGTGYGKDALQDEVVDLIFKRTGMDAASARRALESLGLDMRLVMGWLHSAERPDCTQPVPIRDFLREKEQRDWLMAELRALDTYDAISLLVSTDAVTQLNRKRVAAGQYAAEDCFSTTRKPSSRPKLLQAAGRPFSDEALKRIAADQAPPAKLSIEGFGQGAATSRGTNLLGIAQYPSLSRRKRSLERLQCLGLGCLVGGIFRTGSPYRELVQALYEEQEVRPESIRDGEVFGSIMGKSRHLADALDPADLRSLTIQHLQGLLPNVRGDELAKLHALASLWDREPNEGEVLRVLASVFCGKSVRLLRSSPDEHLQPMRTLSLPCFGLWETLPSSEADSDIPDIELLWAGAGETPDVPRISRAVAAAQDKLKDKHKETTDQQTPRLRVLLLGPGADALERDPERLVAVLRLADAYQATWEGELGPGLLRKGRAQLRLSAISPFQIAGGLPPGSPLFRGREEEVEFIQSRARKASVLIVGGRQVGKTSLLNRINFWAGTESDLEPLHLEVAGVDNRKDFLARCACLKDDSRLHADTRSHLSRANAETDAYGFLRGLCNVIRDAGRQPLFLLNEVDRLFENDLPLVEIWRGMSESNLARFVMVGYSLIGRLGALGDTKSPFFNFTVGTGFGGRAISLGALSIPAAQSLLKMLEDEPLGLRWVDEEQKRKAYELLLSRSYRIPWVVQRYGQLLVERMDEERRDRIAFEDVKAMLGKEGGVVWQYFNNIDFRRLGFSADSRHRLGLELVLYSLARSHYFLGGRNAPIRDPRLPERRALDLGFTVEDARGIVEETLRGLLVHPELEEFHRWFDPLDLDDVFRLLTLTLTLEPDPEHTDRYGFLLHILPRELHGRCKDSDPNLDNLIVDQAVRLLAAAKAMRR